MKAVFRCLSKSHTTIIRAYKQRCNRHTRDFKRHHLSLSISLSLSPHPRKTLPSFSISLSLSRSSLMESSASMKTRFKNRGFNLKAWFGVCFKPGGADGDALEPTVAYTSILSSALKTVEGGGGWRRRGKAADDGFCFWRILKKAFNETTLVCYALTFSFLFVF